MTGMAAIAFCAAFTSCSKNESLYDPEAKDAMEVSQIYEAYNQAFIKTFGQPAANQDWGFGSGATTRTVHKKDPAQGFDYENEPPAVTAEEAAYVYDWFKKEENKGLTAVGKDWDTFYLQQVYGTMNEQKKGLWNKYDQNYMTNHPGATSNWVGDEEFSDKGGMDYLILTDNNGYEEHVLDFNAETGGPYNIVYMTNSSALYFGYHGSWDNSDRQLFKLAQITVPGYCFGEGEADRTGWYVGLSLYGEKEDNSHDGVKNKRLGEQRKDWGDDWILKVVPGETTPPPSDWDVRVIAEDLNAKAIDAQAAKDGLVDSDWDFNDVVFDVKFIDESSANVKIVCAGGVLPLYVDGHEVHEALGHPEKDADGLYKIIGMSDACTPFRVDGISRSNNGRDIKVEVKRVLSSGTEVLLELRADTGLPAAKIAVKAGFTPCGERKDIRTIYPNFSKWVQKQVDSWYPEN